MADQETIDKFKRARTHRERSEAAERDNMPRPTPNANTRTPMPQADTDPGLRIFDKQLKGGFDALNNAIPNGEPGIYSGSNPYVQGRPDYPVNNPLDALGYLIGTLSHSTPGYTGGMPAGGPKDTEAIVQLLHRGFRTIGDVAGRLLAQRARAGDVVARNQIVEQYLPMLQARAQRTAGTAEGFTATGKRSAPLVQRDDLVNQYVEELSSAVEKYDPEGPVPLSGFMRRQADPLNLNRARNTMASTVPQPERDPLVAQIRAMEIEWAKTHGGRIAKHPKTGQDVQLSARMPDRVIANRIGLPEAQVRELRMKIGTRESVDFATIERTHPDPTPSPLAQVEGGSQRRGIEDAIGELSDQDRVLYMAYRDPDNPRTQAQLAQEAGISQPGMRKRLMKIEKFIKDFVEGKGFSGGGPSKPISGGSDVPDPWGSKPTRTRPLTARELGENAREAQTNPRFTGDNPRFKNRFEKMHAEWEQKKRELAGLELRIQQTKRELEAADKQYPRAKEISGGAGPAQVRGEELDDWTRDYRRFVIHGGPAGRSPDPQTIRQLKPNAGDPHDWEQSRELAERGYLQTRHRLRPNLGLKSSEAQAPKDMMEIVQDWFFPPARSR